MARSGNLVAVGADDSVYLATCLVGLGDPFDLVAYTGELTEKWRLTIGGYCPASNLLITDDGLLYFARSTGNTEIVAIQTPSPGLARTAWPSSRHDNRATSWLSE